MKKRLLISIVGKVQGVTYRGNTKKYAESLNIKGWVKNNSDGAVSIVAEGEEEKLQQLVEWCEEGPRYANVKKISTSWENYIGDLHGFDIIY